MLFEGCFDNQHRICKEKEVDDRDLFQDPIPKYKNLWKFKSRT